MNKRLKQTGTLFAAWLKNMSRPALTLLTVLLGYSTMAHATVFDSIGNYLYGGFTGPLAKALAVVIFIISILGIKNGGPGISGGLRRGVCVGRYSRGSFVSRRIQHSRGRLIPSKKQDGDEDQSQLHRNQ